MKYFFLCLSLCLGGLLVAQPTPYNLDYCAIDVKNEQEYLFHYMFDAAQVRAQKLKGLEVHVMPQMAFVIKFDKKGRRDCVHIMTKNDTLGIIQYKYRKGYLANLSAIDYARVESKEVDVRRVSRKKGETALSFFMEDTLRQVHVYDREGKLLYFEGKVDTLRFEYLPTGQLVRVYDLGHSETEALWMYDYEEGQLRAIRHRFDLEKRYLLSYDAKGRLAKIHLGASVFEYIYDKKDRLKSILQWYEGGEESWNTDFIWIE